MSTGTSKKTTPTHQNATDKRYFKRCGHDSEQYGLEDERNAPCGRLSSSARQENWKASDVLGSTVDSAREPTGLPRKMKVEVEVEQMLERLARDRADRALTDVREHRVQQFAE